MKIQVTLVTSDYRGDHAADVRIAYEARDGETVAELVQRVRADKRGDCIELRVIEEERP